MSYEASTTAIPRIVLLAGFLLAALALSLSSFLPAFAQEAETIEYAEDRTDEVVAYTAVDPEGRDITWSLGGTDPTHFDINGGVLTFKNQPDYETKSSYSVTVTASDGTTENARTWTLTISIINVDEAGTVTLGNLQPQLNTPLTATLSDPDGLVPTAVTATNIRWRWAISTSPNGPWTNIRRLRDEDDLPGSPVDEEAYTYANAVTSTYIPHRDDVGFYMRATATYTDGHGVNKSKSAVSVNPVVRNLINDAPVFVYVEGDEIPDGNSEDYDDVGEPVPDTTPVARKVAENSPAGTTVGAPVMAIDEDGDTITYELVDTAATGEDEESFTIDSATGQIRVKAGTMLNTEADDTYTVTVRAKDRSDTDATQSRDEIEVAITVTDVPEAPSLNEETTTTGLTAISTPENTSITAAALSTYTATDHEDDAASPQRELKWSLSGDDSDMFELCDVATDPTCAAPTGDEDTAGLRFKESPNYEALSSTQKSNGLKLTVTVTDSAGMTDSRNVTVTVTNVNEPGTATLSRVQPQVGTSITASLTDDDGTPTGVTWRWATSTDVATPGDFIGGQTRSSYTPVAGDVGSFLWAFASYTDPQGSGKTATTTQAADYTVKAKNEYCAALNSDSDRCTSRRNGNVRPVFPDQDSGTTGIQNTQTTRSIGELTDTGVSTPSGTNIGDFVTATDTSNLTTNSDLNTSTGTTTAPDLLTYTLEGPDRNSFDIDRRTAQLMTKAPLDYETKKSYRVTVRATDPSGLNATINVTINVNDGQEDPEVTSGDADIKVPENTATSTVLSTYTAADDEDDYDDPNDDENEIVPLKWSLSGTDSDDFGLSDQTGASTKLMFKESLSFESPKDRVEGAEVAADNVYKVTVTVTDSNGDTDSSVVTVTVTNVEEPGTVILLSQQPQVDFPLTAKLIDPDGEEEHTPPPALTLNDSDTSDDNLTVEAEWQWARSTSRTGGWTDIEDAESNIYMATSTDVGYYLRATATYADGHGKDKTKSAVSSNPVTAKIYTNSAPVFVYVQGDEIPGDPYPDIDGTAGPDDLNDDDKIDEYAVGDKIPDVSGISLTVARKVAENSPDGTTVGPPVFARDIGQNGRQENLTYELVDIDDTNTATEPEDFFTINSATGQIRVKAGTMLDRESTTPSYTVTVIAKDPFFPSPTVADTSDSIEVVITVTDVQEAPKIIAGDTATSTPESITGTPARAVLATYAATDEEDDYAEPGNDRNEIVPLKWSLSGVDSDMFQLCDDASAADACDAVTGADDIVQLRFKESPDYEALSNTQKSNGLKLTVTVTDSDDMTDSRNVTVKVTNLDEAGTVTLSRVQPQVGTSITASLTDLDGTTSRVTWRWATSTSDTAPGDFIGGQTRSSYTPVAGDVGDYLWAFASYTDPQGSGKTATTTQAADYTVKAKNEYCSRLNTAGDSCSSRRNGNVRPVFPDQDGGTTGIQNTHTTRSIGERTAEGVSTPSGINIGAVVTATDIVNVTVPSGTDLNTSTATTSAPDLLTYTLEGTDANSFDIDRRTAQLMTKAPLDFETKESYSVRVKATDPSGLNATINVTINVVNDDEPPRVSKKSLLITGTGSRNYPETETNRQVGTYSADGPEGTRLWTLSGDDLGDFSISSVGALTFRSQPDYENPTDSDTDNVYRVTVTATVGDLTDSLDVTVTVTNVDEPGTVSITPSGQPRVGIELSASLTDEDGAPTGVSWLWETGSSATGSFTPIAGATQARYTPIQADAGNYLRATASYTDPQGPGKSATSDATSGAVLAASGTGNDGTLALSVTQPVIGNSISATLHDDDSPDTTTYSWVWERSSDNSVWSAVSGATGADYTVGIADAGNYLRATLTYTDASGVGQTASATTTRRVPIDVDYDTNYDGAISGPEVLSAVADYFSNAISAQRVLQVVALYFR